MIVAQLIEQLKMLPPYAVVYAVNYDGCNECNPEGTPMWHEVESAKVIVYGDYPNYTPKDIVELS